MKKMFVILMVSLLLVGCNGSSNQDELEKINDNLESELKDIEEENSELNATIQRLEEENQLLMEQVNELENQDLEEVNNQGSNEFLVVAATIMNALAEEDFTLLANYVSPIKGVRFSPYQYVDIANDQVFTASEIGNFFGLSALYEWGSYDGSGEPIKLNTYDYFYQFVYDEDYIMAPNIGQNTILSFGNTINNVESVYPSASYVEFYFPGFDPQFAGMDWSSLTLVMEFNGNNWELVGIIHGQWTI